ncbi:MAG: ArsA family ATPase [Myxococcota bacterium]
MASVRVRMVSGKGGVGKTTVATAIALAQARAGQRVLLAEVDGRDRVAALLGVAPVGPQVREVLERLYVVDMQPREAIREYVLMTLRFEALYQAVFENRFVRRFLRLIPALGELVMLGKVWYHEREVVNGRPRFDVLVVDAPATGHVISMLRTPGVVERAVPPGPLRENARQIRELFSDAKRTRLHLVTTPEEMPVNETLELLAAARGELGMALGALVINQHVPPLPAPARQLLGDEEDEPAWQALQRALVRREGKQRLGESYLSRLPAPLLHAAVTLPRLASERLGVSDLEALAPLLTRVMAEDPR